MVHIILRAVLLLLYILILFSDKEYNIVFVVFFVAHLALQGVLSLIFGPVLCIGPLSWFVCMLLASVLVTLLYLLICGLRSGDLQEVLREMREERAAAKHPAAAASEETSEPLTFTVTNEAGKKVVVRERFSFRMSGAQYYVADDPDDPKSIALFRRLRGENGSEQISYVYDDDPEWPKLKEYALRRFLELSE